MKLSKDRVMAIIKAALKEDLGRGDITTASVVDKFVSTRAAIVTNEDCIVCGLEIAEWIMAQVDYSVRFKPNCKDSDLVGSGKDIAFIEGRASSILRAERTMINFVSFLSGVSTVTKKFVDKAKPYGVKIMDTRKTIPLLRYLEKYAVSVGGGTNHRMGLYDQVLIKDNHLAVAAKANITIGEAIRTARRKNLKGTVVEVEVKSLHEFEAALAAKPDIIMLDNMNPEDVLSCTEMRKLSRSKPLLEVSGGINLDTIVDYAKTKVDAISVGAITSSLEPIDMSLDMA